MHFAMREKYRAASTERDIACSTTRGASRSNPVRVFCGLLHCCIIAKLVHFVLYSAETRGLQDTDLCTATTMASVYLVSIQAAFPAWELSTYAVNRDMKYDSLREVGRKSTVQNAETPIQQYRWKPKPLFGANVEPMPSSQERWQSRGRNDANPTQVASRG